MLNETVFLRVLEYYTGILFLTTNRVGALDEAFKSRIHLPLYFPPLKQKQTIAIWRMNLKRTLERKNGLMEADEDDIIRFAENHFKRNRETKSNWNGRQIRNAFQTAAALAEYDAQNRDKTAGGRPLYSTLRPSHFRTVAQLAEQFDLYINSVSGHTDRSAMNSYRNDDFQHWPIELAHNDDTGVSKLPSKKVLQTSDVPEDFEDRDFEQTEVPHQMTPRQSFQKRESVIHDNDLEDTAYPQIQARRRRRLQSTPTMKSGQSHDGKYLAHNPLVSTIPGQRYSQQASDLDNEVRKRAIGPRRLSVAGSLARSRQLHPQRDAEPEEPDYSEEDSESII